MDIAYLNWKYLIHFSVNRVFRHAGMHIYRLRKTERETSVSSRASANSGEYSTALKRKAFQFIT